MISFSVIYLADALREIKIGKEIISNGLGCIKFNFFGSCEIRAVHEAYATNFTEEFGDKIVVRT